MLPGLSRQQVSRFEVRRTEYCNGLSCAIPCHVFYVCVVWKLVKLVLDRCTRSIGKECTGMPLVVAAKKAISIRILYCSCVVWSTKHVPELYLQGALVLAIYN